MDISIYIYTGHIYIPRRLQDKQISTTGSTSKTATLRSQKVFSTRPPTRGKPSDDPTAGNIYDLNFYDPSETLKGRYCRRLQGG